VATAFYATAPPPNGPLLVKAALMEISVAVAARPSVPPEEELRTAVLADRLGYSELWVGEGWVWDSFALATAIGVATEQIALTVGPLPVHVRDPATIARAAASTAALVRRPVGVALGTSSVRVVERMHGRSRRRAVTALGESAQAAVVVEEDGRLPSGQPLAEPLVIRERVRQVGNACTRLH
jgi:alkanesulfonate monooxygenase SsuD/methylene tetrahydromethanopterin reductase-like flavin-dependent oxidoreductase (luciferase family)